MPRENVFIEPITTDNTGTNLPPKHELHRIRSGFSHVGTYLPLDFWPFHVLTLCLDRAFFGSWRNLTRRWHSNPAPSLAHVASTDVFQGLRNVYERILVSDRAHLDLGIHVAVDGLEEVELGGTGPPAHVTEPAKFLPENSIGTTKRGKHTPLSFELLRLIFQYRNWPQLLKQTRCMNKHCQYFASVDTLTQSS